MARKKSSRARAQVAREYRSVREEADRLGVGETLLLEAIRDGGFPHRRFGRRILLVPSESDEFLTRSGVSVEQALERCDAPGLDP